MDRSHAVLSARHRLPRRHFLRTARLNAVGFSALGGVCLVAATTGALALRWTGRPPVIGAALGPAVVLTGLVALDRRKWAGTTTGFSFTDDAAATRAVADQLAARGLPVDVEEHPPGSPALRYAHRHARQMQAALEDLGIPAPFT
ncbi:hypothetical protein [Modestobacter sp. VKM Ac-2985]|uniref:hypothetical protein n=1 Tax=Modestobacter sp. VKM Ac-2985 TaxID=3004139 RepID=UPI0022AB5720|nr:hypothetical protein [Modestobacter sp. VKM Ac-2985]MCZ2839566.1 hypothetical protein [Modestobacter sp. VKM Ac-2985]